MGHGPALGRAGGGSEQDLFLVRGTDGAMTSVTKLGGADGS